MTYAAGSGGTQSFSYDGFGNLTAKVGTGSAPSGSYPVNASNNRLTGESYDANGNIVRAGWAYDYENRLMWGGGKYFLYDSSNRKGWEKDPVTGYETITFYGVDGKRMATYGPVERTSEWVFARGQLHAYFAGKRLAVEDRLGSSGNGRYFYPYGDPRQGAGVGEFATYPQDTTLGLQYAINRWYLPGQGRFTTADPYRASGGPAEPGSWNRYAYVGGDPANRRDPRGLLWCIIPGVEGPGIGVEDCWNEVPDAPAPQAAPPPPEGGARIEPVAGWDATVGTVFSKAFKGTDGENCAKIFTLASDVSIEDVLMNLAYGTLTVAFGYRRLGTVEYAELPGGVPAQVVPSADGSSATLQISNGAAPDPSVSIYWNQQSNEKRVITLLHELGHIFNLVSGLGSSTIEMDVNPDGTVNMDAQRRNDERLDPCRRALGLYVPER